MNEMKILTILDKRVQITPFSNKYSRSRAQVLGNIFGMAGKDQQVGCVQSVVLLNKHGTIGNSQ